MRCQLTTVRSSSGGGESRRSQELETGVLTIGRGTDQHVHVRDMHVALDHARLTEAGRGKYRLEALSRNGIVVNGRRLQDCTLNAGDRIELGRTSITLEPPSVGFDLVATVRRLPPAADRVESDRGTSRRPAGRGLRLFSWLAFLAVLVVGLLDPLVSHFAPEKRKVSEAMGLPGTDIWLPGPMAAPHEYFGHECTTCHQQPFQPVPDEACKDCHRETALHVPGHRREISDPAAQGCESCHLEHAGADRLVMTSQSFCADCHSDTSLFTGQPAVTGPATDFAREHPPLRVTLASLDVSGALEQVRVVPAQSPIREQSNLLFPHDVHLDPEGVDSPDGEVVMSCSDCHDPDAGGGLMAPIEFKAHCQSCHLLSFDLSAPERQVPHGDPQTALNVMVDFYAQLALRGGSAEVPIEVLQSTNPAESLSWARAQAVKAAQALFEDRACMQCHEVRRLESEDGLGWAIAPIFVNERWLPAANFDHASHAVAECADCHDARGSDVSSDILLPDIETCRQCHGGESSPQSLNSSCIACHDFHSPGRHRLKAPGQEQSGTLSMKSLPDAEAQSRQARGIDPRRRRPGEEK